MPKVISYGEDALTYWALTKQIDAVLNKLGDTTHPDDCLLIYRPSFGRRGGDTRSEFGEFDAILATPMSVYLIESKWDKSSEIQNGKLGLRNEQKERHNIFTWYLKNWDSNIYSDWADFVKAKSSEFNSNLNKKIAPAGSLLAKNLEYIVSRLQSYGKTVSNVVLYLTKDKASTPQLTDSNFNLVTVEYHTIGNSSYFYLK